MRNVFHEAKRMLSTTVIAVALAAGTGAIAQPILVPAGAVVRPQAIGATSQPVPEPDARLTVLLLVDTTTQDDFVTVRKWLTALWPVLQKGPEWDLALFSGQNIQRLGPFKTRAQLQAALTQVAETIPAEAPPLDAVRLYEALGLSAAQFRGNWQRVLIAGQFPELPPLAAPFAEATLIRRFGEARVRAGLWPFGSVSPAWLDRLAAATSGVNWIEGQKEFAAAMSAPQELVEMTWKDPGPPLSQGFRTLDVQVELPGSPLSLRAFSLASGVELPPIANLIAMEQAIEEASKLTGDAALEKLTQALGVNPRELRALRMTADIQSAANRHEAASKAMSALAELAPSDGTVHDRWGGHLYAASRFDEAEKVLTRARELNVRTAVNAEQLGRIRVDKKDDRGALPLIAESLEASPRNQPMWLLRADVAGRLSDEAQRAMALERAFELGGLFVDRRMGLIRHYRASGNDARALFHVDRIAAELPRDVEVREAIATHYEGLAKPDRALELWRQTLDVDPKRELAHHRVARLLFESGKHADSLRAAELGIATTPQSGRLHTTRSEALEALGRVYESRHRLLEAAATVNDATLALRGAEKADVHTSSSSAAYVRAVDLLAAETDKRSALRRALVVALRDGDAAAAAKFRERLKAAGDGEYAARLAPAGDAAASSRGAAVPGGVAALAEIARTRMSLDSGDAMEAFARVTANTIESSSDKASDLYQEAVKAHFARLAALSAFGQNTETGFRITLRTDSKPSRQAAEKVLSLLGWKMKNAKSGVTLEAAEKGARAERHETTAALAMDETGMKEALEAGKPFVLDIPVERVACFPDEAEWKAVLYPKENPPGGLGEVLTRDARNAKAYAGLNSMDPRAARMLVSTLPLRTLIEKYSDLLFFYGAALAIENGRAAVPGGRAAEAVWAQLAGVSPANPQAFLRALVEKQGGVLLAYFSMVSQFDRAHQEFFTKTPRRTKRFFEIFAESDAMKNGAKRLAALSPLFAFLRDVPLTSDGHVDFPGSPEVWMVAKGQASVQKMIKKLKKTAAPDEEDDIMIRLSSVKYRAESENRSELDNFLAVSAIDRFRAEPLDEAATLLLAQQYAANEAIYPHFTNLTALTQADFEAFFAVSGIVRRKDRVEANRLLGILSPSLELLGRLELTGALPPDAAAAAFRQLMTKLAQAPSIGAWSSAVIDVLRGIGIEGATMDASLRDRLIPAAQTFEWEFNGSRLSGEPASVRRATYDKVLSLQKVPSLATIYTIDSAARKLAAGQGGSEAMSAIVAETAKLPSIELPKDFKISGRPKENLESLRTRKLNERVTQLRQQLARKKQNPKDVQRDVAELLDELAHQTALALTGAVYALYLDPEDLVVAEDPLLLRKHEFTALSSSIELPLFRNSHFQEQSEAAGSYFEGSFGQFAYAAGAAAGASLRTKGTNSNIVGAALANIRQMDWSQLTDAEIRLAGLSVRAAREWIVQSAVDPAAHDALAAATLGLLSQTRRTALLAGISARDWERAWQSVTLTDLYLLGAELPVQSAAMKSALGAELVKVRQKASPKRLAWLGAIMPRLCGCARPALRSNAPYEEFARFLRIEPLGERTAELKLHLAVAADELGIAPSALALAADALARRAFLDMKISDPRDWQSVVRAYGRVDAQALRDALEGLKR